ncbi:dihydrolipoamide acetyltransferase family protein [Sporosarcina obsidiansis]|uniref:dihydrolipoamide acetyltransferase family protein n=1 Tax=Sporosarcina obsidiansis TaxID=2660748 RepID=UPI00129A7D2C|nr:dihydrolipoamide acetyltransferase family protein [Sporosarcina obsidiansis]
MVELLLPETMENQPESVVMFWHKQEGSSVEKGEVLVEIQTEKVVFEIEAPASGQLEKVYQERGAVVSVGDLLAKISSTEQGGQAIEKKVIDLSTDTTASTGETSSQPAQSVDKGGAFIPASPYVRRLAQQLNVDLSSTEGTGPGGRITEQDLRDEAERSVAIVSQDKSEDFEVIEVSPMRRTIAKRMKQSLQQTAQLTETTWADVTELSARRKQLAPEVNWNSWILRAATLALQEHPHLNARFEEDKITLFKYVHIGVAVETERGLLVPSIKHAEGMTLSELNDAFNQVTSKAQAQTSKSNELMGSTFTITNLGSMGIQFFTPILNPPEVAILGVGQIEPHLVLEDQGIVQKQRLPLSLTFDHQLIDGALAARFLKTVVERLGKPESLV